MDKDGFKKWLLERGMKPKLATDAASRAKRVEEAFQKADSSFSYEREYLRDQGSSFSKLISRRGVEIKFKIDLPIGTNQMDSISSAAKKYFQYLLEKSI